MPDSLLVARDGAVTTLTLNRPAVRNAVDGETMLALRDALLAAGDDGATRVIVIAGAGGAFCSGADLTRITQPGITAEQAWRVLPEAYHPALLAIAESRWPVLAAVDGVAAGLGCDLALACDMRLVSPRAQFAELFIRVGLIPDGGGSWMLPRLVGMGRALELMYTGVSVPAEQALAIGLANQLYPAESFAADVRAFAERLAAQAPLALTRIRQAVRAAQESSFADSLAREAALQREILTSPNGLEGFRAFLEKRPPRWE